MSVLKNFWKSVKNAGEAIVNASNPAFNLAYPTCRITQKCPFEYNLEHYRRCQERHGEDCPLMSIKLFIR